MALYFNGTNQNALNEGGIGAVDVNVLTAAFWFRVEEESSQLLFQLATTIAGGFWTKTYQLVWADPLLVFRFMQNFDNTNGIWAYANNDLTLNTWYHILISHDRSNVVNDPITYLNGSSIAFSAETTPIGNADTGEDSIVFGENVGGGFDLEGSIAEVGIWTGDKSSLAPALAKGYSPALYQKDLKIYWNMVRDGQERMQGANLTLTGAVAAPHPPIIYPAAPYTTFVPTAVGVERDIAGSLPAMAGALNRKFRPPRAIGGAI